VTQYQSTAGAIGAEADARLTDLEIKASYAEDLLDALNRTVFRQQEQIDRLQAELLRLRDQLASAGQGGEMRPRDERPPHY
jgi:SlyX protein